MFDGLLSVVDRCESCGLDLRAHESGDGPAVFVILFVGFLIVGAALIVEVRHQPSYWLHMAIWPPLVLGLSLGLLRPIKAAFVAIQYRHRSTAAGDDGE